MLGDDILRRRRSGPVERTWDQETLGPEMTVVGRGAKVEGTLVSTESIRIDGQVKGKIAARCDVILSSHSHVEADIRAQNVLSGGTLKGTITARTRTEVAQGGRVEQPVQGPGGERGGLVLRPGEHRPRGRPEARQTVCVSRRRAADGL